MEAPESVGTDVHEVDLPMPLDQAKLRMDLWLKAILMSLLVIAPVVALGVTQDIHSLEVDDDSGWNQDALFQVALPGLLLWIIIMICVSKVTTRLAFDMLAEGSVNHLKEAIRTNMMNNGVVLALFLTILVAMLQMDVGLDGTFARNYMWYRIILVMGIEACVRGLLMISLFLMYCEPLSEVCARQFAVDNMLYLGEPTTCVISTLVYFVVACLTWVFIKDGKWLGCALSFVTAACTTRVFVVLQYLSAWETPHLLQETRERRKSILTNLRKVDGTGDIISAVHG